MGAPPASPKSRVRSPVQSQGSPAFESPILKAACVLKGGSDVICSSEQLHNRLCASRGPVGLLDPVSAACPPRRPEQPYRVMGLQAASKRGVQASLPEWLFQNSPH